MRKILLALALCVMSVPYLSGQVLHRWTSGYDNPTHHLRDAIEGGEKCAAITDSGEVYVTASTVLQDSGIATLLIKFSREGNVLWTQRMGFFAKDVERTYTPLALTLDPSGNIYVAGYDNPEYSTTNAALYEFGPNGAYYHSMGFSDHRGWAGIDHHHRFNAVVTDKGGAVYAGGYQFDHEGLLAAYYPNGYEKWIAKYDSSYVSITNLAYDGKDGIYAAMMESDDSTMTQQSNALLIKYDTAGNFKWSRRYQRPPSGYAWTQNLYSDGQGNVFQLLGEFNGSASQAKLLKISSAGKLVWSANISDLAINGTQTSAAVAVIKSSGTIYVTGQTVTQNGNAMYLLALDKDGKQKWVKTYADTSFANSVMHPQSMTSDSLNNVYITSLTEQLNEQKTIITTMRYSERGKLMWVDNYSVAGEDTIALVPAWVGIDKKGFIYSVGHTEDIRADPAGGDIIWLKYEQNLNQDTTITDTTHTGIDSKTWAGLAINLYPNPAKDYFNISVNLENTINAQIDLVNTLGQTVESYGSLHLSQGLHTIRFSSGGLEPGIYLLRIAGPGGVTIQRLMITK
jgi:hypothetical protein